MVRQYCVLHQHCCWFECACLDDDRKGVARRIAGTPNITHQLLGGRCACDSIGRPPLYAHGQFTIERPTLPNRCCATGIHPGAFRPCIQLRQCCNLSPIQCRRRTRPAAWPAKALPSFISSQTFEHPIRPARIAMTWIFNNDHQFLALKKGILPWRRCRHHGRRCDTRLC